jgi:toxin YoeB
MKMAESLEFDRLAFEDLAWWVEYNRKQTLKIIKLIQKVQRHPFHGIGKSEKLKMERKSGIQVC